MARFDAWDEYLDEDRVGPGRGAPPPPPPPRPGPDDGSYGYNPPDDGTGGGDPVIPDDIGTHIPPSYGGPMAPIFDFPTPPQLRLDPFSAPTLEQAQNEPGYQFGLESGQRAIDRSAAARGVTNTGNTLTDLVQYGQNYGQQFYGNMFNRAMDAYDRYVQNQMAMFAPQMADYNNRFGAAQAGGLASFDWLGRLFGYDWEADQRNEDRILQTMLSNPAPPPAYQYH